MSASPDNAQASEMAGARAGRWPDFIVIGAMKSGTTSLFETLCNHPRLFMCEPKEPMFFSRDPVFERGYDWYRSLFAGAGVDQLAGEASTCYSRYPHFGDPAERIHAVLPDVKLIYMLRHPVERAYSHYGHEAQYGRTYDSFEQALERDPSIIDASLYMMQIEQYLRFFDRGQMFIVTLDDYKKDASSVLAGVQRFLGLDVVDVSSVEASSANRAGDVVVEKQLTARLRGFRRWPGVKQVADLVPGPVRQWVLRRAVDAAAEGGAGRKIKEAYRSGLAPLTEATRRRLLERFEQPTRDLEVFLGREFPAWHA